MKNYILQRRGKLIPKLGVISFCINIGLFAYMEPFESEQLQDNSNKCSLIPVGFLA